MEETEEVKAEENAEMITETEAEEKTEASEENEKLREQLASANSRLEQLERERCLLLKGVPADDVDYYAFKIAKLVTPERDFGTAADAFLKEHGVRSPAPGLRFSTGAALGAQSPRKETAAERMNDIIRSARQ